MISFGFLTRFLGKVGKLEIYLGPEPNKNWGMD